MAIKQCSPCKRSKPSRERLSRKTRSDSSTDKHSNTKPLKWLSYNETDVKICFRHACSKTRRANKKFKTRIKNMSKTYTCTLPLIDI